MSRNFQRKALLSGNITTKAHWPSSNQTRKHLHTKNTRDCSCRQITHTKYIKQLYWMQRGQFDLPQTTSNCWIKRRQSSEEMTQMSLSRSEYSIRTNGKWPNTETMLDCAFRAKGKQSRSLRRVVFIVLYELVSTRFNYHCFRDCSLTERVCEERDCDAIDLLLVAGIIGDNSARILTRWATRRLYRADVALALAAQYSTSSLTSLDGLPLEFKVSRATAGPLTKVLIAL